MTRTQNWIILCKINKISFAQSVLEHLFVLEDDKKKKTQQFIIQCYQNYTVWVRIVGDEDGRITW